MKKSLLKVMLQISLLSGTFVFINADSVVAENQIETRENTYDISSQTAAFEQGFNDSSNLAKGTMFRGFQIRWYLSNDNVVHIGDGQWEKTVGNKDDFSKNSAFTGIKEISYQIDVSTSGSTFLNAFSPEGNAGVTVTWTLSPSPG